MVEADLEFPEELRDKVTQFPPCPESLKPKEEWVSDYQRQVMKKLNAKITTEKLTPHLMKREKLCFTLQINEILFIT